jgi:C-methyltransferase-like protein/putative zinc binding protein/methyltransferase family protein
MTEALFVERCRSCGGPAPRPFLSLGETPIANALPAGDGSTAPEKRYPLAVGFCPDCTLVQLTYALPAEAIFSADYPYFSSFSDALRAHAREHALTLIKTRGLDAGSSVVEVASNDGYLLRNFVDAGIPVLGIEPTPGPAAAAREVGVQTLEAFFGDDLARQLRADGRPADVIIANNVMAHVPDLNGFVAGFRTLIADDGLITIENPYVRDLIEHSEFDTIYHEHFCYFSCWAVAKLMRRHDLFLNDVEYFPKLHGGTLRWHVSPVGAPTERVRGYLADEEASGLTTFAYYADFGTRVRSITDDLVQLLGDLKAGGASIAAYGAAAKGATLLNSAGIDHRTIDFVADRNSHKQGHLMPGARLPIVDPSAILERMPDYLLVLAWNFLDEIVRQQDEYARRGGRFIVPIPEPRIL